MKTRVKQFAAALVLSVTVLNLSASELMRNASVSEPGLVLEEWMVNHELFEVNKPDVASGTVVDIAVSNPDFSILVEAVKKADLAGALSAEGPFTVFAPTNEAFNALFKQLGVSGIKDLTAEQLTPILT